MATHYKGERIDDLLSEIDRLTTALNANRVWDSEEELVSYSHGYATLVVAKAKLTALRGEHGKD